MCRITCKIMVNTPVGLIRSFSQNLSGKKRVTQSIWNIVLCVEMGNSRRLDTTIVFWHRLLRRRMQDGPAARYDFETEIWMKCNNLSRFESAPNQAGLDCGQSCFLLCEQWIILRHGAWLFTWLRLFLGQLAFWWIFERHDATGVGFCSRSKFTIRLPSRVLHVLRGQSLTEVLKQDACCPTWFQHITFGVATPQVDIRFGSHECKPQLVICVRIS